MSNPNYRSRRSHGPGWGRRYPWKPTLQDKIHNAFMQASPLISQAIVDLVSKFPSFLHDCFPEAMTPGLFAVPQADIQELRKIAHEEMMAARLRSAGRHSIKKTTEHFF